jgi:hypothetical protein
MVLLDDGVIVHTLDEGAVIDTRVAAQVIRDTELLAAGQPVAVVVDLRKVAYADLESREVFANKPSESVEVATALVVGPRVAQFLATRWVDHSKPTRDTSIFEDVDEAVSWAEGRLSPESDDRDETAPSS